MEASTGAPAQSDVAEAMERADHAIFSAVQRGRIWPEEETVAKDALRTVARDYTQTLGITSWRSAKSAAATFARRASQLPDPRSRALAYDMFKQHWHFILCPEHLTTSSKPGFNRPTSARLGRFWDSFENWFPPENLFDFERIFCLYFAGFDLYNVRGIQ